MEMALNYRMESHDNIHGIAMNRMWRLIQVVLKIWKKTFTNIQVDKLRKKKLILVMNTRA